MYDIDSNGSVDRQEMLRIIEVRLNSLNNKQLVSSNPSGLICRTHIFYVESLARSLGKKWYFFLKGGGARAPGATPSSWLRPCY
jgi:hypothetical protein